MLAKLKVDISLVVFALDVGDVDGDEDIRLLLLEAEEGHDDGGEVGGGRLLLLIARADARGLGRDEGVGWSAGPVFKKHCQQSVLFKEGEAGSGRNTYSKRVNSVSAVFQILTVLISAPTMSSR